MTFDPDLFLVAETDGELVGTAIGGFDGRRGMIYHLAVDNKIQRQGLGSMLMEELEARLRDRGCLRAYLLVTPENINAMEFYRKRGWSRMNLELLAEDIG